VQQNGQNDYRTLPAASQQENSARDQSATSPYLNSATSTLDGVGNALLNATATVRLAYDKATPEQKRKMEGVERDLHDAYNSSQRAKQELSGMKPEQRETLSKDGKLQFNAASRGDPRSMETQVANQHRKPPQKTATKVVMATDKKNALNEKEGKAKQDFNKAESNDPGKLKLPSINSKQVEETQPKPQPRPSYDMAGGADRMAHQKAKSADHQATRKIPAECVKLPESLQQGTVSSTQQQAARGGGMER